jgi:flagellar assembly factor FliW
MITEMNQEILFIREIPGFPGLTQFSLEKSEENWPFASLQSLEDDKVGFVLSDPFSLFSEYQIDLSEDIISDLEILIPEEVQVLGIITYRSSLLQSTINLQAPLIINTRTWKAAQIILSNTAFLIRQPLLPVIEADAAASTVGPMEEQQEGGQSDVGINAKKG